MPGILPMKVIKVGTSTQSRIAQACDRCRSKKIRCDGVTPCCTQCKNVGFECKTSDKLSRRAFPRGYTESLEERVRALEAEVRELKDLLDEKDEKIDLLSKIHAFSPGRRLSNTASPTALDTAASPQHESGEEVFKVQQVPFLQKPEQKSDPFFMGSSSTRAFVDTVKTKIQENGKPVANIDANVLLGRADLSKPAKRADLKHTPRIVSDHLVNVFFQEWSPLFPVLHRPSFLSIYEEFVNDSDSIKDPVSVAQLNLVFSTAALAKQSSKELIPYFESQWQGALGCVINENKLSVLQCLILAQLYCLARGDYSKLSFYTGLAVNLSRRLGLHQSQKRFSLGALTRETRKKVFWTLYTLDAFAAVTLGLPKLMKDEDIETEDPADVDDENVNERGFQATLPGESTKLSSALALFRAARILSKVINDLYPASSSYELSFQKVGALNSALDAWRNGLAPHLRLEFSQDKPSTNVISSRCPLLGLAYYYIKSLIHRPVLGSGLGGQAQSSVIAVADASKHMIQILQLLDERGMSYTMCINKTELIVSCGFGLIPQMLDLPSDSKLYKDSQLFITSAIELLEGMGSPSMAAFRKIVSSFAGVPDFVKPPIRRTSSSETCPPIQDLPKNPKGQLQAIAARFSFNGIRNQLQSPYVKQDKRQTKHGSTVALSETVPHNLAPYARHRASHSSLASIASEPVMKRKDLQTTNSLNAPTLNAVTNLDYLPLGSPTSPSNEHKSSLSPEVTDWDQLISSFDPFDMNASVPMPMPNVKGSSPRCIAGSVHSQESPTVPLDWTVDWNNPDSWNLFDMSGSHEHPRPAKSVLSIASNESLTIGDDFSSCDLGSEVRGYSIPHEDFYSLDDVDAAVAVPAGLS